MKLLTRIFQIVEPLAGYQLSNRCHLCYMFELTRDALEEINRRCMQCNNTMTQAFSKHLQTTKSVTNKDRQRLSCSPISVINLLKLTFTVHNNKQRSNGVVNYLNRPHN